MQGPRMLACILTACLTFSLMRRDRFATPPAVHQLTKAFVFTNALKININLRPTPASIALSRKV